MSIIDTIKNRRTIRKFEDRSIDESILKELVDCARLSPSGANLQPLKYVIITKKTDEVFSCTTWAAYLKGEATPKEGERPRAYIAVLADTEIREHGYELDAGAAIMSIILSAEEKGLATCWIGAINRNKLREVLDTEEKYIINSLVAIGYPAEKSFVTEFCGDIKYFKGDDANLRVPKRSLNDIILKIQ